MTHLSHENRVVSPNVLAYRKHKLGSVAARPRIVAEYHGAEGWHPVRGERLATKTARRLLAVGISQVRVRRWFGTVDVSLRRFLGDDL